MNDMMEAVKKQRDDRELAKAAIDKFHDDVLVGGKEPVIHPVADKFSRLKNTNWDNFKQSIIDAGGVKTPIVIDEKSRIVDGRNRLKALLELREDGYEQLSIDVGGTEVMIGADDKAIRLRINQLNVQRRHLTPAMKLKMDALKLADAPDTRSDKQKAATARKSKSRSVTTSPNGEVVTEPKVALNKMVCDSIDCGNTKATREIKRALAGLGKESVKGKHYTKSEAAEILDWLGDNPKVEPKPKAKTLPSRDVADAATLADTCKSITALGVEIEEAVFQFLLKRHESRGSK